MSFHWRPYQNQNFSLMWHSRRSCSTRVQSCRSCLVRVARVSRDGSRTAATSAMELFVIIVNSHLSFYKTTNPAFAFLLSFIENLLSEKTAIVRNKHVSIMNTRKVTQYGFLILLQLMLPGVASETSSAK